MGTNDDKKPPVWVTVVTSRGVQSLVLLLTGVALTVHESIQHGPERPSLYILFAGMMGLPAFLLGRDKDK